MPGLRASAKAWGKRKADDYIEIGCERSAVDPCVFYHPEKNILLESHGDDTLSVGKLSDIRWFEGELTERFDCNAQPLVGLGKECICIGSFTKRIFRVTENGWEYEGDPKHILRLLDIFGMQDAKTVTSPGIKEQVLESDDNLLNKEDRSLCRTGVGFLLYAASDRIDLRYAVKDLMRDVSAPAELSMRRLRRIIRYTSGARRLVNTIDWQTVGTTVEAIVDADHAGCLTSRKSTSGGSIRVNKAYICDYSVTQSTVALSSGESEFLAMVAGIKLLYVANIMRTVGFKV